MSGGGGGGGDGAGVGACRSHRPLVGQQDRFGDLPLRSATLPALPLDRQIGLFLGDAQIALQDPLGAIEHLARFEPLRQLAVLGLEPRQLDLGAHQEPDGGDQLNLAPAVLVRMAMLQVDDGDEPAAAQHGHRQERLVVILGQLVEHLEARIFEGVDSECDRLPMLGDPAGDPLADPQLQPIDDVGVRIFDARSTSSSFSST